MKYSNYWKYSLTNSFFENNLLNQIQKIIDIFNSENKIYYQAKLICCDCYIIIIDGLYEQCTIDYNHNYTNCTTNDAPYDIIIKSVLILCQKYNIIEYWACDLYTHENVIKRLLSYVNCDIIRPKNYEEIYNNSLIIYEINNNDQSPYINKKDNNPENNKLKYYDQQINELNQHIILNNKKENELTQKHKSVLIVKSASSQSLSNNSKINKKHHKHSSSDYYNSIGLLSADSMNKTNSQNKLIQCLDQFNKTSNKRFSLPFIKNSNSNSSSSSSSSTSSPRLNADNQDNIYNGGFEIIKRYYPDIYYMIENGEESLTILDDNQELIKLEYNF